MVRGSDPRGARRPLRWRPIREALGDFWRDYHWPVKLTLALIVLASFWGMAVAAWPELEAGAGPLVRALSSDSAITLLTFLIAFLIAVNFYMRARRGVLDGDEHYNIARALAFGYFKNFLVPALQLAERTGRELHIFRPESMTDLGRYSSQLEPRVREAFEHEWLPLTQAPTPGGPPRRTVLALQSPRPDRFSADRLGAEVPFYFDAPTALFTVNDFYDALNRRRIEANKEPISDATVRRYQNGQIDSFFRHLAFLFRTDAGLGAVSDLVPTQEALAALHARLREVTIADLQARYPG